MFTESIRRLIVMALKKLKAEHKLSMHGINRESDMSVERPRDSRMGDFASNIAMLLAKDEKKAPRFIAELLKAELENNNYFKAIEVAGPGFLNFYLSDQALAEIVPHVAKQGKNYGVSSQEKPKKVLLEFVSANPTGGLHLGHARGAFVGDAMARLLKAAGYQVTKEFYVNDVGNQVETLARTVYKRYCELFGQIITIEKNEYPGDYVIEIARALKNRDGDFWLAKKEEDYIKPILEFAVQENLSAIKTTLKSIDINIDNWYFEHNLHENKQLEALIDLYNSKGMLYEASQAHGTENKIRRDDSKAALYAHLQEGGTFLKTTLFGDEEDRIIQRKDGRFVYLTADLAYHHEKYLRGFDRLINVFGGDHAGHVGRLKAAMAALGHAPEKLEFAIVQMVRLIKEGQELKFSKRSGEVYSLEELSEEIGKDAARFVFLMRSINTQFDLDLDLVKSQSSDNPVFYVQYGHARMATILKRAEDLGIGFLPKDFSQSNAELLQLPEERELLLKIAELPDIIRESARVLEPHRLIYYASDLVKSFHSYFTKYRASEKIISLDKNKTESRLSLVFALRHSIANALNVLGIDAPEHMELTIEDPL
jgi:arginyl-tRNA synthetase